MQSSRFKVYRRCHFAGGAFAEYICYILGNLALEAVKNKSVDYGQ